MAIQIGNNTNEIRSWWWGRMMPEKYVELRDLSSLTTSQEKELQDLKHLVEVAERQGIKLPFGQYVKKGDLHKAWSRNSEEQECDAR